MSAVADYGTFLASKRLIVAPAGVDVPAEALHPALFPFQRDLTRWALRKGRAALFTSTGTGKTLMQLAWAQRAADRVLILAPLAVAQQTVREGARWGIPVTYARSQGQAPPSGITITNYEMLARFDPSAFGAVVLDESGILKNFEGKVRSALIAAFRDTPLRLCCTATPAPNDIGEIANHTEFLGVMTRTEMLAAFFVHDDAGWRLKGHAREAFYRWLASWGMSLTKPSDLGYPDDGYDLPPLEIRKEIIAADYVPEGRLFAVGLKGIGERATVRKATAAMRVERTVQLVRAEDVRYSIGHERSTGTGANRVRPAVAGGAPRGAQCRGSGAGKESDAGAEGGAEGSLASLAGAKSGACSGVSSGDEEAAERPATSTICRGRSVPGGDEGHGTGVVDKASRPEEGRAPEAARDQPTAVRADDGRTGREVRDMRLLGPEQQELLPAAGSLPRDECGSRPVVHELQPGVGEVRGQGGAIDGGRSLSGKEPWIIWCGLNAEQDALEDALGDECVSVGGSLSVEEKIRRLDLFLSGERRILLSKPTVCGFGLNLQLCARMVFVGLSDSYEQYFQCIRRCWRYGQQRPVHAYVVLTDLEETIYENVLRKERDAAVLTRELIANAAEFERAEIGAASGGAMEYRPAAEMRLPAWLKGAE